MNARLKMSFPKILNPLLNAISSPASESGVMRSVKQDGRTTDKSGQDPARANLSALRVNKKELTIKGICGPLGSNLSASQNLSNSLGSKLRAKQLKIGSILYQMTWKEWVTPLGRRLPQLAVSVPRNREKDFILWVTPNARDYRDLSTTRGYLAQRKRHSPSVATKFLELGGNWKQVPQAYRILMGLPFGWHENFLKVMETRSVRRKPKPSSKPI